MNSRIDDVGEDANSKILHGDDIRRSRSRTTAATQYDVGQLWIPRTADNAHSEGSTNKEDAESQVYHFESGFDVDSWACCFCCNHGNILRTHNGEQSRRKGSYKPLKTPNVASADVLAEGLAITEVLETVGITSWVAANHGDKGEEEEGEDQDDLASRQPEFSFAICSYGKDIDSATRCISDFAFGQNDVVAFGDRVASGIG